MGFAKNVFHKNSKISIVEKDIHMILTSIGTNLSSYSGNLNDSLSRLFKISSICMVSEDSLGFSYLKRVCI